MVNNDNFWFYFKLNCVFKLHQKIILIYLGIPIWHAKHQVIFILNLKLESVWPHYNPAYHVSIIIFIQRVSCLHVLAKGPVAVAHVSLLLIVNEDWYLWALTLGLGFRCGRCSHWSFSSHVLLDKLLLQHFIGHLNACSVKICACQC